MWAVIARYEGHVSQYRGDGIEVYFGWPAAQEDAAERAVRAGLEIVEAVKAVAESEALSVRVGISTGIVVISETGERGSVDALGCGRRYAQHRRPAARPSRRPAPW